MIDLIHLEPYLHSRNIITISEGEKRGQWCKELIYVAAVKMSLMLSPSSNEEVKKVEINVIGNEGKGDKRKDNKKKVSDVKTIIYTFRFVVNQQC